MHLTYQENRSPNGCISQTAFKVVVIHLLNAEHHKNDK